MRPRGRVDLLRTLALVNSLQPTRSVSRRVAAPLSIGSGSLLKDTRFPSISSRRYYSRDPLQAEHEANTVRGNRAARSRTEEQAQQYQEGKQNEEGGSYKREFLQLF